MKRNFRKIAGTFFRTLAVTLVFTTDVKVRADVLFDTVKGQVEVEKSGKLVSVNDKVKLQEPFEVETFNRATAKFAMNSIYLGMGEKTLVVCLDSPKVDLSWGQVFVSVPNREHEWFSVRTPQAEVGTNGGEFIAVVHDRKTTVHVVSGKVEIKDRSSGDVQNLRAGYSDWIAGLSANGYHVKGRPEAINFEWVMAETRALSRFSIPEFQNLYDHLKPLWRQAVDDVSQQTHDQVIGDMQLLKDIQEQDAKREARHKREQAKLKKEFRDRTLGDPDGLINTEWKSSSGTPVRQPANTHEN